MRFPAWLRLTIPLLALWAASAAAQPAGPPDLLVLRGRVAPRSAAPMEGSATFTATLFDRATGGTPVWSSGPFEAAIFGGVYTLGLGEPPAPPLPPLGAQGSLWLELSINGQTEPRREVRAENGVIEIEGGLPIVPGPVEDKRARRSRHFYQQRAYPGTTTPTGALRRARERAARILPLGPPPESAPSPHSTVAQTLAAGTPAMLSGNGWTFIGPQPIAAGQTTAGSVRGPVSGRVTSLAVHPTQPDIVFAAGAQGGVWKSIDAGATFTPLTDHLPSLAMGSIALAPSDPDIIYIGTGEAHSSIDSYYGAGVFKSTDGGTSWSATGALAASYIARMVVHPADPQVVYAAGYRHISGGVSQDSGIWRSVNGGASWSRILVGSASDLVMHPSNPLILYAAMGYFAGAAANGIYRTTDGGDVWTKLGGAGTGLPSTNVGRINLDIARTNGSILHAAIQRVNDFRLMGVFRSADSGLTWTLAPNIGSVAQCAQQCWYDMYVASSPNDPDTIYFGGLDLYKSTDAGAHFVNIAAGGGSGGLHVDQHAVAFHPTQPNVFYVGNDGGVWKTADSGSTWTNLNEHLGLTQFQSVAGHPTDAQIAFGGTQDNGTNKYSGDLRWLHVDDGDGGAVLIDPNNPSTIYHTYFNVSFVRSDAGGAAGSWLTRESGLNTSDPSLFYIPVEMSPSNPATLYLGTNRIYRTTNRADSWTSISPDLGAGSGRISAIGLTAADSQVIYAGTSNARIQKTTNGGASWTNVAVAPLPNRFVTSLTVDPANASRIWATYSGFNAATPLTPGHLFLSTNAGASWTDMSANLPDIPANAFAVDPGAPGTWYLATDLGVFITTNNGLSWAGFSTGLPNVAVLDMSLPVGTRTLYAATHGRSIHARPGCTAPGVLDGDGDGVADTCDNCPALSNASQADGDLDGAGAACDCNDANPGVRPGAPEFCNGVDDDCDPATPECPPICGDGAVDPGEQCDDSNLISGDGCSASCVTEFCGDGVTQPALAEECDDSNTVPGDGCTAQCQLECGDGSLQGAEQCDDGNRLPDDGCSAACRFEVCGDGALHRNGGEACDDGNTTDTDFCTNACGRNVVRDAFVAATGPEQLAIVRRTDAASVPIGPTDHVLDDLAWSGAGVLFGFTTTGALVHVDPVSGATSFVASTGVSLKAIDFSPVGDLYGISEPAPGEPQLIRINPVTGQTSPVGAIGFPAIRAMAFNAGGTLYAASQDSPSSHQLITIDTSTGAGSLVNSFENASPAGIDFAPDGKLLAVTGDASGRLMFYNIPVGLFTTVGQTGLGPLSGIRFAPSGCPLTPATEVCDGADNDCDGQIDDGFAAPAAIGASLRFVAASDLAWDPQPGALAYNLYRGQTSAPFGYSHGCAFAALPTASATDPATPSPGAAYYYLASGRYCSGEGNLGVSSSGATRPNAAPCP